MKKILLGIGIVIFSLFFCLSLIAWETGWLENKVVDNLTIWGYVSALKGICVVEDVSIGDDLYVKDSAYIGNLTISGNTELANVGVDGLCSRGDISLFGDIYLGGQDIIYGDTKLTFGDNGLCLIGAFSNTGNLYSGGGEMRLGSLSGFRDNAGGDLEFTEDSGVTWTDIGAGGAGTLAATLALGADATDISITSLAKLEGVDAQVYVDLSNDGFVDLEADTGIRITATTDFGDEDITSLDRLEGLAAGEYIDLGTADYIDIVATEAIRNFIGINEIFTVGSSGVCLVGSLSLTEDIYLGGQDIVYGNTKLSLGDNGACIIGDVSLSDDLFVGDDASIVGDISVLGGSPLYVDVVNNEVGINDSTPSYALDVSGIIQGSSDIRCGGWWYGRLLSTPSDDAIIIRQPYAKVIYLGKDTSSTLVAQVVTTDLPLYVTSDDEAEYASLDMGDNDFTITTAGTNDRDIIIDAAAGVLRLKSQGTEILTVGTDGACLVGKLSLTDDIYLGGQDIVYGTTKLSLGANGVCVIGNVSMTEDLYVGGFMSVANMKVGTDQANAGAAKGELWAESDNSYIVQLGQ